MPKVEMTEHGIATAAIKVERQIGDQREIFDPQMREHGMVVEG